MTGLTRFALFPEKHMHHIAFSFHTNMKGSRKGFAGGIRNLFINVVRKSFGGFIRRIESDDSMSGSYAVHIWTRAVNRDDPTLEPLWNFVINLLGAKKWNKIAKASTIEMEQDEPADDRFRDRFILSLHHGEPEDGSTGFDLDDDTASVICIDSMQQSSLHYCKNKSIKLQ